MQRYRIKTLVDITKTDVLKENIDPLGKQQQDNFNTLLQILEMRGNVFYNTHPYIDLIEWENKKQKTWIWEFWTEQHDLYKKNDDPVGALREDLKYIPFNSGCSESVKFIHCFFEFDDNISIELIS